MRQEVAVTPKVFAASTSAFADRRRRSAQTGPVTPTFSLHPSMDAWQHRAAKSWGREARSRLTSNCRSSCRVRRVPSEPALPMWYAICRGFCAIVTPCLRQHHHNSPNPSVSSVRGSIRSMLSCRKRRWYQAGCCLNTTRISIIVTRARDVSTTDLTRERDLV